MAKIYPQAIKGRYRWIKDIMMLVLLSIYCFGSWIRWNRAGNGVPNQAILIDIPNRHAYFFGIEIAPDEMYYVTGILIIAAISLFFITSLLGRVWCGYTCPHTVFTDLFVKIETFFQGDRNARIKLDNSPNTKYKIIRKVATHITWVSVAFLFAFWWVCYFYGSMELFYDLLHLNINYSACIWLISLTVSTYFFAGFLRQRVCMHMCPYGRFQSAMIDNETITVNYDYKRGEPRKSEDPTHAGECIDCYKCVVVCPMDIDIRNGFQMECIACGLCIDACNSVMQKLGRPLNLIGYSKLDALQGKSFFRLKCVIFISVLLVVSSVMLYSLFTKDTYRMIIIKEHTPLFTIIPDGSIRNVYLIKIHNKSSSLKSFNFHIEGLENLQFMIQNYTEYTDRYDFTINPHGEVEYRIFIKIPPYDYAFKQKDISFILQDPASHETIVKMNTFILSP